MGFAEQESVLALAVRNLFVKLRDEEELTKTQGKFSNDDGIELEYGKST